MDRNLTRSLSDHPSRFIPETPGWGKKLSEWIVKFGKPFLNTFLGFNLKKEGGKVRRNKFM